MYVVISLIKINKVEPTDLINAGQFKMVYPPNLIRYLDT